MLIPFEDNHTTVIGRTRSGKTYATKKSLAAAKCGVLFFNVQLEAMPRPFIKADGSNTAGQLLDALDAGKKINFIPSTSSEIRNRQLEYLIDSFYDGTDHDFYLVVDECHLFDRAATDKQIQVATTGLRFGIKGVFLSQRMQNIDKTLVTQSTRFVMFETNLEAQYFRSKGIPIDEIEQRLVKGGKYSYCVFDGRHISGPQKVS